jgi:hypothetical protein
MLEVKVIEQRKHIIAFEFSLYKLEGHESGKGKGLVMQFRMIDLKFDELMGFFPI